MQDMGDTSVKQDAITAKIDQGQLRFIKMASQGNFCFSHSDKLANQKEPKICSHQAQASLQKDAQGKFSFHGLSRAHNVPFTEHYHTMFHLSHSSQVS